MSEENYINPGNISRSIVTLLKAEPEIKEMLTAASENFNLASIVDNISTNLLFFNFRLGRNSALQSPLSAVPSQPSLKETWQNRSEALNADDGRVQVCLDDLKFQIEVAAWPGTGVSEKNPPFFFQNFRFFQI